MNLSKLNEWLTLLANLGVLIGLVFLIMEIDQSNRIATVSTEIAVRGNSSKLNEAIYEDYNMAQLISRAIENDTTISPDEFVAIQMYFTEAWNSAIATEVAYSNGLAPETTHLVNLDSMSFALNSSPIIRQAMSRSLAVYPSLSEFQITKHIMSEIEKHE